MKIARGLAIPSTAYICQVLLADKLLSETMIAETMIANTITLMS